MMNQLLNTQAAPSVFIKFCILMLVVQPVEVLVLLGILRSERRKFLSAMSVSLLVAVVSAVAFVKCGGFTNNQPYYSEGFLTSRSVSSTEFNKVMKKNYGLEFSRTSGNRDKNVPFEYRVKDLKHGKTYYNCQLNFTPVGDKVRLNAVTCGTNILQTDG